MSVFGDQNQLFAPKTTIETFLVLTSIAKIDGTRGHDLAKKLQESLYHAVEK